MDSTAISTNEQSSETAVPRLSAKQARRLCEKIARQAENLRELLLQLRDGQGWLALGYASWASCCEEEFGYSKQHANRLIKAEEINRQVEPMGSIPLSERQARELGKVPEEKRQAVLDWAIEKADGKPLTAAAIHKAAKALVEANDHDDAAADHDDRVGTDDEDSTVKAARLLGTPVEMIEKADMVVESGIEPNWAVEQIVDPEWNNIGQRIRRYAAHHDLVTVAWRLERLAFELRQQAEQQTDQADQGRRPMVDSTKRRRRTKAEMQTVRQTVDEILSKGGGMTLQQIFRAMVSRGPLKTGPNLQQDGEQAGDEAAAERRR
jgi:hypothetical protein